MKVAISMKRATSPESIGRIGWSVGILVSSHRHAGAVVVDAADGGRVRSRLMMILADADELVRFTQAVLERIGAEANDAAFTASVIVASDVAGHASHGVRRLPEYVDRSRDGLLDASAKPRVESDTGTIIRIDGARALGHVAMRDATDLAAAAAKRHGVSVVALRGASHAGRLADYCERAACAAVATLLFVNDSGGGQAVAPPGGVAARLSTNPVAFGIPRTHAPHLVVDMATSIVAYGRLMEALDTGEDPAGWLAAPGVLRYVDYKAFAFALVADALAGALTGGGTARADPGADDQAALLVAIDVAAFRDPAAFVDDVERMLCYVRDVPLAPGADAVRIPGEASHARAGQRAGGVVVADATWQRLGVLAEQFGLAGPAVRR
jgi:hydroxycarboxylate dehydrogenase B